MMEHAVVNGGPVGSVNSLTQTQQRRTNLINAATLAVKYDIYTNASFTKTHTYTHSEHTDWINLCPWF